MAEIETRVFQVCKCGKPIITEATGGVCSLCYARTFQGKPKRPKRPRKENLLAHRPGSVSHVDSNERARRIRFSIFRIMGMAAGVAAERSGYPKEFCEDTEFCEKLEEVLRQDGVFADVEIPLKELFAAEAGPSLAVLVNLRDHSENEKVRIDCAKTLLALAGYTASVTRIEPVDIAEREVSKRSLKVQRQFRETGRLAEGTSLALPEGKTLQLADVLKIAQENDGHLMA